MSVTALLLGVVQPAEIAAVLRQGGWDVKDMTENLGTWMIHVADTQYPFQNHIVWRFDPAMDDDREVFPGTRTYLSLTEDEQGVAMGEALVKELGGFLCRSDSVPGPKQFERFEGSRELELSAQDRLLVEVQRIFPPEAAKQVSAAVLAAPDGWRSLESLGGALMDYCSSMRHEESRERTYGR